MRDLKSYVILCPNLLDSFSAIDIAVKSEYMEIFQQINQQSSFMKLLYSETKKKLVTKPTHFSYSPNLNINSTSAHSYIVRQNARQKFPESLEGDRMF